jgi:hypothetical protein
MRDLQDAGHWMIFVGRDRNGHPCVCDNHGHAADGFATQDEAVRFAFEERAAHPGALIVVSPAIIEADRAA